jgi:hypothetical protein
MHKQGLLLSLQSFTPQQAYADTKLSLRKTFSYFLLPNTRDEPFVWLA